MLAAHPDRGREHLIPLLQEVQEAQGFVSREAVAELGAHLGLPSSRIYGVATFYNQFRFQPLGRYHVQVCRGTACHVKGSQGVFQAIKRYLQLEAGQTARDGLFSLEVVACLGACGLAPLICVNGEFHGGVDADSAVKILRRCRREAESA
ncbi:MAG: NADH-quinone oxidoreductase subunit NuoE [Krumholzibacteria bacterium]|nr:NADH-quinone oxidoreductase subunit NuoE [Candidatus Krumholzibacteria bacterium]